MLSISLNLFRAPGASSVLNRSSVPLYCERAAIGCGLRTKLLALLYTAVFICSGSHHALAMNAAGQTAPTPVTPQLEEHGPSQKAVEIARPLPRTPDSMSSFVSDASLEARYLHQDRHKVSLPIFG
jgi:hypothetical protein